MIRHAAVVAIVVCLAPSRLHAQTMEFTVNVQSAAVRKAPSTGSPEIGQASRDTVLEVTRDVGDWVKVAWPDAQDGIGYVHHSMGSLAPRGTLQKKIPPPLRAAPATPEPAAAAPPDVVTAAVTRSAPTRTVYVAPPTHIVGVGGRMGGSPLGGFGITSRVWSRSGLGIQLDMSRSTVDTTAPGGLTSLEFAPSLIHSFPDRVTDTVWVRPYVGAAVTLSRSTLRTGISDVSNSVPDKSFGFRTFGGGELSVPSVPRFAVSADLRYSWAQRPFDSFDAGGLGFSVAAHWYVK
jgi:hypothetical protein